MRLKLNENKIIKSREWKFISALLFVFFLLILSISLFQNCGDVNINANSKPIEGPPVAAVKEGVLCSQSGPSYSYPLRVVFVVDMSFSNIGRLITGNDELNHTIYSRNPEGASDNNGLRFNQIKNFIAQCGGNENIQYSIIGFAENAVFATANSCLSSFQTLTDAMTAVESLKRMQEHDLTILGGKDNYPFYLVDKTNYSVGLSCLKDKIQNELALVSESSSPIYYSFFVTDGRPYPKEPNSIYTNRLLEIRNLASQSGSNFAFFPYFYSGSGTSSEEQSEAISILNEMASSINPGQTAGLLQSLEGASENWCGRINPGPSEIYYHLTQLYGINLTALMEKNKVLSDSDMDGVTDENELQLGWDPVHPRSTGYLDGLCWINFKSKEKCQELAHGCSNEAFGFGLNTCDQKASNLIFGTNLIGIDSDSDGILDYLELIRHLNPFQNDMYSNMSGDQVLNYDKFIMGLDVQSSLQAFPVEDFSKVKLEYDLETGSQNVSAGSSSPCPSPKRSFPYKLTQMPTVSTLEYIDPKPGLISLSHGKDENVILLVSLWESASGLSLRKRVYVEKIIIPWKAVSPSSFSDMVLLGEYK